MKTKYLSDKNGIIITALLVGGLWLATSMLSVFAADFSVNDISDAVDLNPGDGICVTAGSNCTLRAAIMEANALAGADTIDVPSGIYQLTITGVDERCDGTTPCTIDGTTGAYVPVITSDASKGDLDITDDVTITGAGSESTIIKWADPVTVPDNDPLTGDRIFHVAILAGATENITNVVIQGLTVENGEVGLEATVAADVCIDDGSGITTVYTPAKLNAYDILPTNNTDANCGTIGDDGKLVGGTIIIDQFRRMGGGIELGGGYAVVTYDEAKEGSAPDDITGGEGSTATIESVSLNDVVVINNWSGADGGGIHSIVPATISRSKISGNTSAGGNGGGLYNEANLTISDTLIGTDAVLTNPNVGENGGGIFFTGAPQTTTTILRSVINGNKAIGGAGLAGRVARFDITNTTISSNIARDIGAGILTAGPVDLQNVTVADNVANTTAPVGGAGLNSFAGGSYTMSNTLLSNNKVEVELEPDKSRLANCGCAGGGDCTAGDLNSLGYNLEDGDTCEFGLSDQINTDPKLVALADNGGLTETYALTFIAPGNQGNSPALDTGDDSNCPNNDQRGSIRPFDGDEDGTAKCDIGAFELANFSADLLIANMTAPDEVFKGDEFTVTIDVFNNIAVKDTNVVLVTNDLLPFGVTVVSATATGGSVNSCAEDTGVVTCTIGDLLGSASAKVTLTLTATTVGDATIAANVTSDAEDGTEPNNSASVTTSVIGVADLKLTATANTSSVVVGNEVTVTFTVANLGDDDATEVSLFGTIPVEASLVSAIPDNNGTCAPSGADVFCELGNLAVAGPSINVVVVMRADLTGVAGTVVDVSASVDAKQRDPDEANNTISASVTITSVPPVITPPPSSGDGGGFCSYQPKGRFDPVLPMLVLIGLIYVMRRRSV